MAFFYSGLIAGSAVVAETWLFISFAAFFPPRFGSTNILCLSIVMLPYTFDDLEEATSCRLLSLPLLLIWLMNSR